MTEIPCALAETRERVPNAIALVSPYGRITYHQLEECVMQCAACLRGNGIDTGNRLAISMPNSPEYVILILALLRIGAIPCPLSTRLPATALSAAIAELQARSLIISEGEPPEGVRTLLSSRIMGNETSMYTGATKFDAGQWATITYTSGSSGAPKPAVLAYRNHFRNAVASNKNIPVIPGDRWILSLPLHHVSGLGVLFRCIVGGGAIVLPDADEPLEDELNKYSVTHLSLVATQLYRMLQRTDAIVRLSKLKSVLVGGGPIPGHLVDEALAEGIPIQTTYGLTEMASQVATTAAPDPSRKERNPALPILKDSLSISEDGEILVRGETLFLGYLDGNDVSLPLTDDGWFQTGDSGRIAENGGLTVSGRLDNMFVSGGENIQPEEIESLLCSVSGVIQAVVVPVEDEEFGHRPVAFIRTDEKNPIDEQELSTTLKQSLPNFKIPAAYHSWPERSAEVESKVNRADFRKRAESL